MDAVKTKLDNILFDKTSYFKIYQEYAVKANGNGS